MYRPFGFLFGNSAATVMVGSNSNPRDPMVRPDKKNLQNFRASEQHVRGFDRLPRRARNYASQMEKSALPNSKKCSSYTCITNCYRESHVNQSI